MVDLLALAGVATISVAHPYSFSLYKTMVSNINLVKDHNCSDSDILTYVSVKGSSFHGSDIHPYAHTLILLYIITFQHKLVYSFIITPYNLFLDTHSISYTWKHFHTHKELKNVERICYDKNIYATLALRIYMLDWYHFYIKHPGWIRHVNIIHKVCYWKGLVLQADQYAKMSNACQQLKKRKTIYGQLPPTIIVPLKP